MFDLEELGKKVERAILVSVVPPQQADYKTTEYLDELAFLTATLGAETINVFIQKLEKPDNRSFVGKGKLEEIQLFVKSKEIDVAIFDDDLSPSQVRNLERELKIKIYDRSLLILDIFLQRAQTSQAKTQVELARAQYILPRLTRMWTHLERQRGGTATRGGAGEKEIETDKRFIRDRISKLKQKLEKIDRQQATQRKGRDSLARVALVGYTNVGKSTIMNLIAKSDTFAENKLFATVDSTVRKVVLKYVPFLLSDTVGFIRKLPHTLVECFKSTLDEVREADVLVHVVDISNPAHQEHIEVVNKTLGDIGASDKPTLLVYNKIDQYNLETPDYGTESEWFENAHYGQDPNAVYLSAIEQKNIEEFKEKLYELVLSKHMTIYPNYINPNDFIE